MGKYPICNHKIETAPKILGKTFILCWRCTGVMVALFSMGFLSKFWNFKFGCIQTFVGILAITPMIADGVIQYYFNKDSTNKRRFLTGIFFGVGSSLVVFYYY